MNFTERFSASLAQLAMAARRAKQQAMRIAHAAHPSRSRNTKHECTRRRRQIARGVLKPQSRGL